MIAMLIWSCVSAATIGAVSALAAGLLRGRWSSPRVTTAFIITFCVIYHAVAFLVMISGGTPIKCLNAVLVLTILGAWGIGAPTGDWSWMLLVSYLFQIAAASAIGVWIHAGLKRRRNCEQGGGEVRS